MDRLLPFRGAGGPISTGHHQHMHRAQPWWTDAACNVCLIKRTYSQPQSRPAAHPMRMHEAVAGGTALYDCHVSTYPLVTPSLCVLLLLQAKATYEKAKAAYDAKKK